MLFDAARDAVLRGHLSALIKLPLDMRTNGARAAFITVSGVIVPASVPMSQRRSRVLRHGVDAPCAATDVVNDAEVCETPLELDIGPGGGGGAPMSRRRTTRRYPSMSADASAPDTSTSMLGGAFVWNVPQTPSEPPYRIME